MNTTKILLLVILTVFLFSSAGFCNETTLEDSGSHHCTIHCGSGGHQTILQNKESFPVVISTISDVAFPEETFYQNLFTENIEHPPAVSF